MNKQKYIKAYQNFQLCEQQYKYYRRFAVASVDRATGIDNFSKQERRSFSSSSSALSDANHIFKHIKTKNEDLDKMYERVVVNRQPLL